MRTGPAFLILAHDYPDVLERLVSRLYPFPVALHVDASSDLHAFRDVMSMQNVDPIGSASLTWGGFSIVDATVRLIERALSWNQPLSKLVLLSGSCYPIRPMRELCEHLAETDRELINFVEIGLDSTPEVQASVSRRWYMDQTARLPTRMDRLTRRVANAASKRLPDPHRSPPAPYWPCFGSQWWALSPESAQHVLSVYRSDPQLRSFYKHVYAPDEQLIHTVLAASKFRASMNRLAGGGSQLTNQETPLHFVFPTAERIVPGDASVIKLLQASGKYFVRKVSPSSAPALDAIDKCLLN